MLKPMASSKKADIQRNVYVMALTLMSNMSKQPDRNKALEAGLQQIEKQFGKGAIIKMSDEELKIVDAIPSGSFALDLALGIRGIPRGRITEIFGPESAGKTTIVYHLIAETQKAGGNAVFIDAEHALDPEYARAIGVDVDNLFVAQPTTGEEALEIADIMARSGGADLIAVDSVAALTPKAELEGLMGQQTVGLQARMMSQAMRKLTGNLNKSGTAMLFTNQIREKVGVMFGSPETTPGGRALKFYASVRMDIRRTGQIKGKNEQGVDEVVGNETRVKIVKNKVAPPFRQAEFEIRYGTGISKEGEIITLGTEQGVLKKAGAFYSYEGETIGQGKEKAVAFLKNPENAETREKIEKELWASYGIGEEIAVPDDSLSEAEIKEFEAGLED